MAARSARIHQLRTPQQYKSLLQQRIAEKVELHSGGNSKRKLRDMAADAINASDQPWSEIAKGTCLTVTTIRKLSQGETGNPQSDTLERVLRHFGIELTGQFVDIKPQYHNKPKV